MKPEDNFAATFLCSFLPIAKDSQQTPEQFHESQIKQLEAATKSGYVQSYSQEMMRLGGEAAAAESLKIIARQVARVRKERDPGTMRLQRKWETVSVGGVYRLDLRPCATSDTRRPSGNHHCQRDGLPQRGGLQSQQERQAHQGAWAGRR